jgi:hypothetical protein
MLKKPFFFSAGLTVSTSDVFDSLSGRMNFDPDPDEIVGKLNS